jgi:hypothetical protein
VPVPPRPAWLRVLDRTEITEDSCWLWQGALNSGYGIVQLGRGRGTARVHRVIYARFIAPLPVPPPAGPDIRHLCHVRNCVNPAHLTLGTRAENMGDARRASRRLGPRQGLLGEANPHSKLTIADVLAIRADSRILREVAADYGVSLQAVWSIRKGRTWRHATAQPRE